ncbi:PPPDE putative peptidase domain-containing protein [Kalaharituber pfeilii]|nr:PPPDE putative peptidase domain-containing protein [Kalaharituber pfeilii]
MAGDRAVELYVYDLSGGLARQFSQALLGTYIEAVYHTSVVVGSREYYYGAGIQTSVPGRTHHGEPKEKILLGTTELPDDVILEYLESIKPIYSEESYDLFMHNCNNFSNDFSMFLIGKGIPSHITSLPDTVLRTEFGQMLRREIEGVLRPITTAPTISTPPAHPQPAVIGQSQVKIAQNGRQFDDILGTAKDTCAIVFFTSAACAPCKALYPFFERKSAELVGRAVFVKADVTIARDLGQRFLVTATPTFVTYSKGEKLDTWTGTSKENLEAYISTMINVTYSGRIFLNALHLQRAENVVHPHTKQNLPITFGTSMLAITYAKVPPLDKARKKLGIKVASTPALVSMMEFIQQRQQHGAREAPLPDLAIWARYIQDAAKGGLSNDTLFPVVDIFRAALVDTRVSSWIAAEQEYKTIRALLDLLTPSNESSATVPYALRLVTLQSLCNLFSSSLAAPVLCVPPISTLLVSAVASSLLDGEHVATRVAASSFAFNLATYIQRMRSTQNQEVLEAGELVEFVVGIVEAVTREEEDAGGLKALLIALVLAVYCAPMGGEVLQVIEAIGAAQTVREKGNSEVGQKLGVAALCEEVANVLGAGKL